MKPDGVDSGVTEPMVALDADPVLQAEPQGEGQEQAPPASQTEEMQQGEPQATETPTAATKPSKDKSADPKAKTKGVTKTKTSTTGARPGSTQSRMTNGVQKPAQTNGLAKKTTTGAAADKKTTTTASKKPVGVGAVTTKTASKITEKKPIGAPKTAGTTQPTKKTSVNGDKTKPKPAVSAPRPASAGTTKPSTTASPRTDKPPVAKTTRPATGTTPSRPASAAPKPAVSAASKTPSSASKTAPTAAKTTTSTAKPSPAKTPTASRALTTSTKSPAPIKKDASKPATPAAKKSTASPLTRPASTKTSKPDTPKAATPSKPKAAVEAKTGKPKDSKPTPSKEINAALKTSSAKNKTASPKKVVGSSTPMPVKRGPKAAHKENEKEDVAPGVETAAAVEAVAVAAAATAAGTIFTVRDNESEVLLESMPDVAPEAKLEVSSAHKLEDAPEPHLEITSEPKLEESPEPKLEESPEPKLKDAPELKLEYAPEPKIEDAPEPKIEDADQPISPLPLETESQLAPETKSEYLPETISELLPETKTELEPEPKSDLLLKPECEFIPETMTEQHLETEPALDSEPSSDILLKSEYDFMPEAISELLLDTKLAVVPEPKSLETELEFTSEYLHDSKYDSAPEPQSEFPLESGFLLETKSEFSSTPECNPETLFETESEIASEPKSELLFETESEIASEPKSELLFETESEIAPEPRSELLFETESEIAPEPRSELLFETESEIAPEPKSELLFETESEIASEPKSELLFETESEIAPEPKSELLFETESEIASEPRSELLFETESEIAPEPRSELLFETESEIAPEPRSELLFETESEIAPEPKSELLFETESEIAPEPKSQLLFETKHDFLAETVPERTVESLLTTTVEDIAADNKDIPSDTEEETPKELVPQLAAQLNLASLEHPSASSTLGTTVMSPPSSPTGESPVHVKPQISAPLQDMYADNNPWAENEPMFSSDITTENLDQEEIRVQEDLLSTIDSAAEGTGDIGRSFSLGVEPDLLSSSHVEHFSSVSPTSPNMEKEEAVEKAEEEINEDDHNEEEEDEEEQQVTEIVKVQTVPETQTVDDFKFGLSESNSTISGVLHYDDFDGTVQQEQAEITSPFQMESCHSNEDGEDFSLKKVEMEQPFMGPPGVKSFSDEEEEEEEEEQEKEDMDTGPEHIERDHVHFGQQQASDHHMDVHLKSEEEEEHDDEDVEMVSEGQVESGSKIAENIDEDDYEEEYLENLNRTAPAPSIPMTTAWGPSNPFVDTWAQPASINITSSSFDIKAADPEIPTKYPAEAWLEKPLCHLTEPHLEVCEETKSSVPVDGANLCAPPIGIGMSQSSTLSGTALAAHSSSETSTPEELRDYDSSSGVESRSDKQQTPVPTAQPDQEQDLGIHLERGDCEEEEAETLPADEILGDAPTAPASVPSSPTTSGDEASDTEGEMQIHDPDAPADDTAALDSPSGTRNLSAMDEDEEAHDIHVGEEDGGTPQSANSVASYGFDCSVSNSNAHSTAESCGKSPGIFSLENEDQLPEEAKDPSLIKELTLPAAAAKAEDLLGCPVDLLPLGQQGESHPDSDGQYLLCGKTGASPLEEADPESPIHLSPQHGDNTNSQPPYYSTICDNVDSFLAGYNNPPLASCQDVKYGNLPSLSPEINGNHYLNLVQNPHRLHEPLTSCPQQQKKPSNWLVELVRLPVPCPTQAPRAGQLKRLEQHQLHLRYIWQRQEQERQQRLWLEGDRQRQELQKQLERQQALRQWQKQERLRTERQKQLERQRQELVRLQRHQEHRQRWHLLQWQLELEQRLKRQQKVHSTKPLYGLCTIYEAMEISEDEYVEKNNAKVRKEFEGQRTKTHLPLHLTNRNLHQTPRCGHDWNSEHDGCPPLLYLPGQGGGTLSPLERSCWPQILQQLNHASATITSVSSYSPTQGSSPQDDWTIVELETYH